MNGKRAFQVIAFALALLSANAATNGLIQLFDGTTLHGSLQGISTQEGVAWAFPAAQTPVVLKPTNISGIRFENVQQTNRTSQPTCRFRFHNGDEVFGDLIGIDGEMATIRSALGGELKSPKQSFSSLQFAARGFKVLYEGPNGPNEWKSSRSGHGWSYKDGALIANGADILGRDLGLTNSSSLEFDLNWNGSFSLTVTVYAQTIEKFDYSTSAYVFYFNPGGVSIQRIQAGAGAVMLGRAEIPQMTNKSRVRLEIRSNKEQGTLSLFADGTLVQRWRDPKGFVSSGTGIVFYSQVESPSLKLSNIKVAEWDGRFEPEVPTNAPTDDDIVFLANKDRVVGKVEALSDGKLNVKTASISLAIPLQRITEVYFANSRPATQSASPWAVRASFPGGERITFQIDKWAGGEVTGRSGNFGPVAFSAASIRALQFNAERAARESAENSDDADWIPELDE